MHFEWCEDQCRLAISNQPPSRARTESQWVCEMRERKKDLPAQMSARFGLLRLNSRNLPGSVQSRMKSATLSEYPE
jgi:hypothetical protein